MTRTTIESIRASFVWVTGAPTLLGRGRFGIRDAYVAAFDDADRSGASWVRPWPAAGRSHFWAYYLGPAYAAAAAASAWTRLVPLRRARARPAHSGQAARMELYAWPHAVGAVLTTDIKGTASLNDAVDHVVAAARTEAYAFTKDESTVPVARVLQRHAEAAVAELGGDPTPTLPPTSPFTLVTVLRGSSDLTPETDDAVHRAVHGLACLNRSWRQLSLPGLSELRVTADADNVGVDGGLYGVSRGRVVWLPRRFSAQRPSTRQPDGLDCYHRNLLALTLQVEAHTALLRWASPRLSGEGLSFEAGDLVRQAARTLAALYVGERPGTYASASAMRQVDDDDVAAIRAAWDHYGLLLPASAASS